MRIRMWDKIKKDWVMLEVPTLDFFKKKRENKDKLKFIESEN